MKWKRGCHLPVLAAVVLLWSMFNISTVIGAGAARVTVDAAAVLSERAVNPLGINTNYIMDDDNNRAPDRPLAEALAEMGVRFLRYPGGEKSDAYLWSVHPFEAPKPTLARVGRGEWPSGAHHFVRESDFKTFKFDPLDFDEFIALCRATGTEPNVVVCYDCIYKPGAWVGRQDLIDTAAAWVRYANVVKGYGVKYWEIGNE
ncbi:MAG: alpha-L-arabinofuranosidase, partial [Patescibacteria group bacterium]